MSETQTGKKTSGLEIISFFLGEQVFSVNIMAVREIRGWAPATPLAHAPRHVMGVINLRGTVIPVIDMALRLTELLVDETAAKASQLMIEYDPQPPFDTGALARADEAVVARVIEYAAVRR